MPQRTFFQGHFPSIPNVSLRVYQCGRMTRWRVLEVSLLSTRKATQKSRTIFFHAQRVLQETQPLAASPPAPSSSWGKCGWVVWTSPLCISLSSLSPNRLIFSHSHGQSKNSTKALRYSDGIHSQSARLAHSTLTKRERTRSTSFLYPVRLLFLFRQSEGLRRSWTCFG